MIFYIVSALVLLVISWAILGFKIATICATISTIVFLLRFLSYKKTVKVSLTIECVGMFMTLVWSLLLKKFNFWLVLGYVVCRLIFLCIVAYEDKEYVYFSEVRRREENQ